MALYAIMLTLHIISACIWVGGHLYLAVSVLPRVLQQQDVAGLLAFEQSFERLGMGALMVQVVTGLWLGYRMLPEWSLWWSGYNKLSQLLMFKLLWLGLTVLVAAHAQLRVIPKLSAQTLPLMAVHVLVITLLSLLFVFTGVGFRFGLPF